MLKCEACSFGKNTPLLDKQIRGDQSRRYFDNWVCNHPNPEVRRQAKQKGWPDLCQEYRQKT